MSIKDKRLYVDVHILQTVPPSCVNRDDTGSPKTAVYGGTTRARVSSQAWKHAMRLDFRTLFTNNELGLRTMYIVKLVAQLLQENDITLTAEKAEKEAETALENAGLHIKEVKRRNGEKFKATDALFFISPQQARALAQLSASGEKNKEKYKDALKENPSVDMAMFGRMVADAPSLKYDAAVQVAHALSTHTVHNEYDYFTAVDDCSPEDTAAAGHLGTVEFNSATLYRYATVNVRELAKATGKETPQVVCKLITSFVRSMPTGKENTFANRTLPSDVYVTIRRDQPVNLCGAFERPVQAGREGFVLASESSLKEYAIHMYHNFANAPEAAYGMVGEGMSSLVTSTPLPEVLGNVENWLQDHLQEYCDGTAQENE